MAWPKSLKCETEAGATAAEIASFVASVFALLSETEISELIREHRQVVGAGYFDPPLDPTSWKLPQSPLPGAYLDFLCWSNGGYFQGLARNLDPLFSTKEIRDYMLGYSVPHWMPGTCPIGFDGGGAFYLFDMRVPSHGIDYPVLWAHAGNLSFDDSVLISPSFQEFIEAGLGKMAP